MTKYLPHLLLVAIIGYLFYTNNSMREEVTILRDQVKVAEKIVEDVQKQADALSKRLNTLNKKNSDAERKLQTRQRTLEPAVGSDDTEIDEIGKSIEILTR